MRISVVKRIVQDTKEEHYWVYLGPYPNGGPFLSAEEAWDWAYERTALSLFPRRQSKTEGPT